MVGCFEDARCLATMIEQIAIYIYLLLDISGKTTNEL